MLDLLLWPFWAASGALFGLAAMGAIIYTIALLGAPK